MNRTTVILLALVILLAHSLAIHQTADGTLGATFDQAHVAYRIARNVVYHGSALWIPGGAVVESYPSPLWIAVCAVAERLYLPPTIVTQTLGILCGLGTVVVLAQFSANRMSGLIAPIFLAASGAAAAAGASGTEASLGMMLVTAAFLAFEKGHPRLLVVVLTTLVVTLPAAAVLVAALFVLERLDRPRAGGGRRSVPTAFLPPLVLIAGLALARLVFTGDGLAPAQRAWFAGGPREWSLGGAYLQDFFLASGTGILVVLPLFAMVTGRLSSTGRRALVLFVVWCVLVVLSGGDDLPMWCSMAPVLPLCFLSIQEAIAGEMDERPVLAPVAWVVLVVATSASFLVSKAPGNLGPIQMERLQEAWMQPAAPRREAFERALGRSGLMTEIREVERLRALSVFLRHEVPEPSTILTFWPGAIGYLSRKRVYDFQGRAYPGPGGGRLQSWSGRPRVDLIESIDTGPDYIVPLIEPLKPGSSPVQFLRDWLRRYDVRGEGEGRVRQLMSALHRYELVSVPVPVSSRQPETPSPVPFLLLRNRDLGLTPRLEIAFDREDRTFRVLAHHRGHQQVVELTVSLLGRDGGLWTMRPMGAFVRGDRVHARSSVLLYPTGGRPIRMLEGRIPDDLPAVELVARLNNPGTHGNSRLAVVGSTVSLRLDE